MYFLRDLPQSLGGSDSPTFAGLNLTGTLALTSAATAGLQLYNTADQTTNYERLEALWSGNFGYVRTQNGGSGSGRPLLLGSYSLTNYTRIILNRGGTTRATFESDASGTANTTDFDFTGGSRSQTSGTNIFASIRPTYNQTSGTAANTDFLINRNESGGVGSGAQYMIETQVNGAHRFRVRNNGRVETIAWFAAAPDNGFYLDGRAFLRSPAAGVITLFDQNATDFARLQFGGTSSSFPALKRNGSSIDLRLADDSTYTNINVNSIYADVSLRLKDGIAAPSATVGEVKIYVDTSDGDLKVIFGDGTIKTLATDT